MVDARANGWPAGLPSFGGALALAWLLHLGLSLSSGGHLVAADAAFAIVFTVAALSFALRRQDEHRILSRLGLSPIPFAASAGLPWKDWRCWLGVALVGGLAIVVPMLGRPAWTFAAFVPFALVLRSWRLAEQQRRLQCIEAARSRLREVPEGSRYAAHLLVNRIERCLKVPETPGAEAPSSSAPHMPIPPSPYTWER